MSRNTKAGRTASSWSKPKRNSIDEPKGVHRSGADRPQRHRYRPRRLVRRYDLEPRGKPPHPRYRPERTRPCGRLFGRPRGRCIRNRASVIFLLQVSCLCKTNTFLEIGKRDEGWLRILYSFDILRTRRNPRPFPAWVILALARNDTRQQFSSLCQQPPRPTIFSTDFLRFPVLE